MAYEEVKVKKPLMLTILPVISVASFFILWELVIDSGLVPGLCSRPRS